MTQDQQIIILKDSNLDKLLKFKTAIDNAVMHDQQLMIYEGISYYTLFAREMYENLLKRVFTMPDGS